MSKLDNPELPIVGMTNPLPPTVEGCICSSNRYEYGDTWVSQLNPDATCPIHGEEADQELADIERLVAADRAVIEAAKAWRGWWATLKQDIGMFIPENNLAAAVDALNSQPWEQTLAVNPVHLESPDGSVHIRPGLGETLKRIETEFYVFTGDDPDDAKVGVNVDGIDDAAGLLGAMPGSAIAIRCIYAGEWSVNRPAAVDALGPATGTGASGE